MSFSVESDSESTEEIEELLRNLQLILEMKIASMVREGTGMDGEEYAESEITVTPNGCGCKNLGCSCCHHIGIRSIGFTKECE